MTIGLLFPAALGALVTLLVPLAIHIARRSEQRPTDFAALRWLRARPRPRSRLRFDEWPLLLLRLALVALAAIWLAQPIWSGPADDRPYVAIVPGARADPAGFSDARVHWLAPGFPRAIDPAPDPRQPVASLIRDLDAQLPPDTPLTIVAPDILRGADADRLRLSRAVTWRVRPGPAAPAAPVSTPPAIAIRTDGGDTPGLRYIRAAAISWAAPGKPAAPDIAPLAATMPAPDRTLVWLGRGTTPASLRQWVARGGQAVLASAMIPPAGDAVPIWRDADGAVLARAIRHGKGRLIHLARPLDAAAMPLLLNADFPARLHTLIAPPPPPTLVAAADYAPTRGGRAPQPQPRPLRLWVALAIALLSLAERWLATSRRRNAAP